MILLSFLVELVGIEPTTSAVRLQIRGFSEPRLYWFFKRLRDICNRKTPTCAPCTVYSCDTVISENLFQEGYDVLHEAIQAEPHRARNRGWPKTHFPVFVLPAGNIQPIEVTVEIESDSS
jgi:hypothetical protein